MSKGNQRVEDLLPPYANPVTSARYIENSEYVTNVAIFWSRSLREFVAGLPTCPPILCARLLAPVSQSKTISMPERKLAKQCLADFQAFFSNIKPFEKFPDPPASREGGDEVADLLEVNDAMLKLPRLELCKRLKNTSLIMKPEVAWTRGLRMFLCGLPTLDDEDIKDRLYVPITPATTFITPEERSKVNTAILAYIENAATIESADKGLGIVDDHNMQMEEIVEAVDLKTQCQRMLKSEYMRKSNSYWPRQLRNWAAEVPGVSQAVVSSLNQATSVTKYLPRSDKVELAKAMRAYLESQK